MAKRLVRGIGVFLIVVVLLLLGTGAALYYLNSPSPEIPRDGYMFKILRGENLSAIAERLKREGLIRSDMLLILFSRLNNTQTSFKNGYFRILPGDSMIDVHELLVSGYQEQVKLTIPEGWTVKKIARYVEDKGIAGREEFLEAASSTALLDQFGIPAENLEGYLYPDTYFFPRGYSAYGVVEEMVENFFRRLAEIAPEGLQEQPERLHRTIIMASIVEREYRREEEAPLIASVFYNRLDFNIGLESCATLGYIITDIQNKPHPPFLSVEDKRIDSPYNTYKWAGLPPGPISSPGAVALKAAFHPADTEFYYFVLKNPNTGEHYFSENLQEHNWAKYYYLKRVEAGG
ncbi:MAG: endolytic transglycosylase MltG [Spirochaetaceae bacterium]|nr:MAG: endolytic transglycosylase MltG [Spirochaetaceae bacterium]